MKQVFSLVLTVLVTLAAVSAPAADFNGDGLDDIAIFRPSTGLWSVRGGDRTYWGQAGDIPAPGKFVHTNRDSIAIFRPSTGLWSISGGNRYYFGEVGDIPIGGDSGSGGGGVWTESGSNIYYDSGNVAIGMTTTFMGRLGVAANSTVNNPHLLLYEQTSDDYARINFRNLSTTNAWAIAGKPRSNAVDARLNFYYQATGDIMSIDGSGRVGIGTTNPGSTLHVYGTTAQPALVLRGGNTSGIDLATFYNGSGGLAFWLSGTGWMGANGGYETFSPYISMHFIPEDRSPVEYEVGDLVSAVDGRAVKTSGAFDRAVVGVICPPEGFISIPTELREEMTATGKRMDDYPLVPVAYLGNVQVKVNAEGGPIESGDLIVPSSVPGVGMKGEPETFPQYASAIGKAREDFSGEEGLVWVSLGVK